MTTTSQTAARSAAPDRRSVTLRELWLKSTKSCVVLCGLEISCIDCDFDSSVFDTALKSPVFTVVNLLQQQVNSGSE